MPRKSKAEVPKKGRAKSTKVDTHADTHAEPLAEPHAEEPLEEPHATRVEPLADTQAEPLEEKPLVDTKKSRAVPTRESVEKEFDDLIAVIDGEISNLKGEKCKGTPFLRTVNRTLKTLKKHALRATAKPKRVVKRNNANSGFNKPVPISRELAKFAGWKPDELKSRVDVTKYICNYIKTKNLQNPDNRRQIMVDKDSNLKKLLKYDNAKEPLYYYSIQTCLKPHYVKA